MENFSSAANLPLATSSLLVDTRNFEIFGALFNIIAY